MLRIDIYKYGKKCSAEDYSNVLINFRVGGLSRALDVLKKEKLFIPLSLLVA